MKGNSVRGEEIDKIRELGKIGKNGNGELEFDEQLWCGILDHVTVYSKDKIIFTFIGGIEVQVSVW